ncbi:MAG TPA: hypothetical protein VF789_08625 [Thermoanaerobaculia bacterium]
MKRIAVVPLVFLLALTLQPARASVVAELAFDGSRIVAPLSVPFDFGNQPLGKISTFGYTICFKSAASPAGSCDQSGRVTQQQQLAPPFFLAGAFREDIATGATTLVDFPVNLAAGQRLILFNQWISNQLGPASGSLVLRGTPTGGAGEDVVLDFTGSGIAPGPCLPSGTPALCLNNDRFKVQSHFLAPNAASGEAGAVELTNDTGYFYFFSSSNVEAVVKVLNACTAPFNRYWVFAGGLTNVRAVVTVTDTERNSVRTYINPQGKAFQPVQDTNAFATCP